MAKRFAQTWPAIVRHIEDKKKTTKSSFELVSIRATTT